MLDRMALITAIGDSVNRMIPPLIVTKKQIDELMLIMRASIEDAAANTNSDNTTILIHKTTFKRGCRQLCWQPLTYYASSSSGTGSGTSVSPLYSMSGSSSK